MENMAHNAADESELTIQSRIISVCMGIIPILCAVSMAYFLPQYTRGHVFYSLIASFAFVFLVAGGVIMILAEMKIRDVINLF